MIKTVWIWIAIVVFVVTAYSIGQTFTKQKPLPSNEEFVLKEKCASQAQEYLKKEGLFVDNQEYTYNPTLNTCLVHFEVTDTLATTHSIVDLLTGINIAKYVDFADQTAKERWGGYYACKGSDVCYTDRAGFEAKKASLFN